MQTLVTIVGARPQFIKAAMLSREFKESDRIREVIIHTGQHYDYGMSQIFFEELGIPLPDQNLGIGGGSQAVMTGRQLEAIERALMDIHPDGVLVYGDTNSTLSGALAAAKLNIPVIHVESGLRSFNRAMPEEINRILTDHISSLLFAPTDKAQKNLEREGLTNGVFCVGDIMYDAALHYGKSVSNGGSQILSDLGLESGGFRLATLHRQENTDDPKRLEKIFCALRALAEDRPLVLPLHPRVLRKLEERDIYAFSTGNIRIIDPVGFKDMVALLQGATVIATDSGGVQKEAYFHGTPAAILRDETEWEELIDMGWAKLVSPVKEETGEKIYDRIISCESLKGDTSVRPFGDGHTAAKIAAILELEL